MKICRIITLICSIIIISCTDLWAEQDIHEKNAKIMQKEMKSYYKEANKYSVEYLEEARDYREEGRFELARQSYLKALSICADGPTLNIIKRELDGVELLIRSMR